MTDQRIEFLAFRRAALSSESYQTISLLCILGVLVLGVIARNLASGDSRLLAAQLAALALAVAYEGFALARVRKALRREQDIAQAIRLIDVAMEAAIPTLGLFILIESRFTSPYQALVAPAVFLYFLFMILSTLRLSAGLSLMTGILSAGGYFLAAVYVHQRYPITAAGPFTLASTYFIYAGMILAGGIAAAVVAGQIRKHVYAALREGELRSKLDQVYHDLEIARSIQLGLLPGRAPNLTGFDIAGWNQPADQTGGDYFDWQKLPDGRLAVSLGDATGHGIGPALVSASCRAYARASFAAGNAKTDLLDRLNSLLAEDLPTNRFVTFVVVFLDPVSSQVRVLSAGHGPILWYKYATEEIEELEAQGIPLGMIAGMKYSQASERGLAPGDMLVLVTDGFYEWENPDGEEFGLSRLEVTIRESRDCCADEVIERLRSAVESFCGGTEQKDDLTAVVIKRKK